MKRSLPSNLLTFYRHFVCSVLLPLYPSPKRNYQNLWYASASDIISSCGWKRVIHACMHCPASSYLGSAVTAAMQQYGSMKEIYVHIKNFQEEFST
jgi:hypothetical protein